MQAIAVLPTQTPSKAGGFITRLQATRHIGTCEWLMGTWLERWERPNCWMALSADQGSSSVRWHLRRWLGTLHSKNHCQWLLRIQLSTKINEWAEIHENLCSYIHRRHVQEILDFFM